MANKGKGKERDTSDDPNKPHDKKDGEDQNEDEEKDKVGDKDGKFNTFSKKLASAFKKKPTSPFPASTSFQGLSSYTAAGPSGVSKFKSRRRRTRSEASTSSSFSAPEIKPEAYEGVGGGGLQPREGLTLGREFYVLRFIDSQDKLDRVFSILTGNRRAKKELYNPL